MALFLTSKKLPVPHGFSTVEAGDPARSEPDAVRLATAVEVERGRMFSVNQVHGDAVVRAPVDSKTEADALWLEEANALVGVKTADCVPILIADPVGKRVAAVHSGWRGTDKRIAARAVEALVKAGSRVGDLIAAIGPSIQVCCYEVSEDLGERFAKAFGPTVVARDRPEDKPHLDLPRAVRATLIDAGVREENVDLLLECTLCDRQRRFFSFRRDAQAAGRHLNFIVSRF